jgi:hypothetical protein
MQDELEDEEPLALAPRNFRIAGYPSSGACHSSLDPLMLWQGDTDEFM